MTCLMIADAHIALWATSEILLGREDYFVCWSVESDCLLLDWDKSRASLVVEDDGGGAPVSKGDVPYEEKKYLFNVFLGRKNK